MITRVPLSVLLTIYCTSIAAYGSVTVDIPAAKDNTLIEDVTGSLSNGSGTAFFVGNTGQGDAFNSRRGLIQFDIAGSSIPSGTTITGVSLSLFMSQSVSINGQTIALHTVSQDWGEGSSNSPGGIGDAASAGDATWLHTFFPTPLWTSAGGDFTVISSASVFVPAVVGSYSWSSAGMVADVQNWLDNPVSNAGWLLLGDESAPSTVMRFNSRESSMSPPVLSVTYIPEPLSLSLLGLGSLVVLRRQWL